MAGTRRDLLLFLVLGTALGGCGGGGHDPWGGDAAFDIAATPIGPFGVGTLSGMPPNAVDLTPSGGSRFSYLGLEGEEIRALKWTCDLPPPANLTPILFLGRDTDSEIYAIMPSGKGRRQLTDNEAGDGHPGYSPDGTHIVFNSDRTGDSEVWVMDAAGGHARNVTNHPAGDSSARWNPQGGWIVFKSDRTGVRDIYSIRVNGTGLRLLTDHPAFERAPEWFPDGRNILFSSNRDGDQDIYRMTEFGRGVRQLTDSPKVDFRGTVSPDGTKIAFHSFRDGNYEIYVMNVDGSNQVNITKHPAREAHPEWAPDGSRIVFNSDRTGMLQVWTMRPDGRDPRQVTDDPGLEVQCVAWYVPRSKRILVGRPELDAGFDPPFGRRILGAVAVHDANSLRTMVAVKGPPGAQASIWKPAVEKPTPRVYVRSTHPMTIIEDRGRLLNPIKHLRATEGVRKCLIWFSPVTGRVTAVKAL